MAYHSVPAHIGFQIVETDIEPVQQVQKVLLQDQILSRQVEHPSGLFQFAEVLETGANSLSYFNEMFLRENTRRQQASTQATSYPPVSAHQPLSTVATTSPVHPT